MDPSQMTEPQVAEEEMQRMVAILNEERYSRNAAINPEELMVWDPVLPAPSQAEHLTFPETVKIRHTDWCLCGNCIPMPTEDECVCCSQVPNIVKILPEGVNCVCGMEYLRDELVSRQHLVALHRYSRFFKQLNLYPIEEMPESYYRKIAYRAFTMWVHGKLGPQNRRAIPSCAVKLIRTTYSAPDESYLWFIPVEEDGNAVDMLF